MTVGCGVGDGEGGGAAGGGAPGAAGAAGAGAGAVTVVGVSGAGDSALDSGMPGLTGVSGRCGVADVVVGVGVGVTHVGRTELRASSSICAMASSSEPDGRPATTCARSEGRMSLTPSMRQSRLSWGAPALMRDNSFRALRHPNK